TAPDAADLFVVGTLIGAHVQREAIIVVVEAAADLEDRGPPGPGADLAAQLSLDLPERVGVVLAIVDQSRAVSEQADGALGDAGGNEAAPSRHRDPPSDRAGRCPRCRGRPVRVCQYCGMGPTSTARPSRASPLAMKDRF